MKKKEKNDDENSIKEDLDCFQHLTDDPCFKNF